MLTRAALVMFALCWTGYWIAGLAVAVLFLIWALLSTAEGPPVLALALTYQWMQVTIGLFYSTLTGEELEAMYQTDWQRMMLIGLGWVTCLAVAMSYGIVLTRRRISPAPDAPLRAVSAKVLYIAYGASLLLTGVVQEIAWTYPMFTQAILAITFTHLGLLFVLTRRFTRPHFEWEKLAMLMVIEIAVGFTGYFAGFREPIVMGGIAILEVFDRRDMRHWLFAGVLAVVLGLSSLVWMSVRGQLRQEIDDEVLSNSRIERFDRARTLSTGLLTQAAADYSDAATRLVDRLWAIKYPGMALDRVPSSIPHTGGELMWEALTHLVTPRFLYPDKPELISDSELVRQYAGARVAGSESNTSIAFGYSAESYVDYGLPWMFVPAIVWGFLLGVTFQVWMSIIRHRELAVAVTTVMFWLALYLFERSWAKTLGGTVTLMVYLGGLVYLIDQWLLMRRVQHLSTGLADHVLDTTA
ncbi:MAG TPA: hypothetical protein VFU28_04590 [Vicinamibacterales bacterium]|nr:hypothetical protein [Vicinamibacterales bacterium]